jgi:hypothetical protein
MLINCRISSIIILRESHQLSRFKGFISVKEAIVNDNHFIFQQPISG